MHKIFNGQAPNYLLEIFQGQNRNRSSSRNNTLILPLPRIDLCKTSLAFSGSKLWNLLSQDIKSTSSQNSFKSKLILYLKTIE